MGRKALKVGEKTVRLDIKIEESTKKLLKSQADELRIRDVALGREYIRIMTLAKAAGSPPAASPSSLPLNRPVTEGSLTSVSGVVLDEPCQPREIFMFLNTVEGILHLAAPWSSTEKFAPVSPEVLLRAGNALNRVRREAETGPSALALRSAVSAHLAPLLHGLGAMRALRSLGQTRAQVQDALTLVENVLRAAGDQILNAGGTTP